METLRQYKKDLCKKDPDLSVRLEQRMEQLKISEHLRAARAAAGLTQQEVADRMRVKRTYVSRLEGRPQNITLSTLAKYTEAVGAAFSVEIKPQVGKTLAHA